MELVSHVSYAAVFMRKEIVCCQYQAAAKHIN